jgi:uncharacterized protein YbaR (Trm112 family)
MTISQELLENLCCPETRQDLFLADQSLVDEINLKISKGLKNRSGKLIEKPIHQGLIRSDKKLLYPVRDGIPLMLIDEGICLDSSQVSASIKDS